MSQEHCDSAFASDDKDDDDDDDEREKYNVDHET